MAGLVSDNRRRRGLVNLIRAYPEENNEQLKTPNSLLRLLSDRLRNKIQTH